MSDPESLLELAESALHAAKAGAGSKPRENTLHTVPALEVTIKLLGDRLRGGGVDVLVRMPPGYPEFCAAEIRADGNARATLDDLAHLRRAAESAVEEVLQNAKETGTIRRPSVDGVLKILAPDSKNRLSARQLTVPLLFVNA